MRISCSQHPSAFLLGHLCAIVLSEQVAKPVILISKVCFGPMPRPAAELRHNGVELKEVRASPQRPFQDWQPEARPVLWPPVSVHVCGVWAFGTALKGPVLL